MIIIFYTIFSILNFDKNYILWFWLLIGGASPDSSTKTTRRKNAPCRFGVAREAEAICDANRPVEPKPDRAYSSAIR